MAKKNRSKFLNTVSSIQWNDILTTFFNHPDLDEKIIIINKRIALWSKQLETANKDNPALTFIRESQIQANYASLLIAMGLYKPAAACMRSFVECGLYYSYFNTHPTELKTLVTSPEYYIDKKRIIDYHKIHTTNFKNKQEKLNLVTELNVWYSEISGVIHGQTPGTWVTHIKLSDVNFAKDICELTISKFEEADNIFHKLLLCSISSDLWFKFTKSAKQNLLKELSQDQKSILNLTIV